MIPVFSIPRIKRHVGSNLEKLQVVNRNLGFKTVKSPTPWPNVMFGYKDEYVSEFFEKLVHKIYRNSFLTWKPEKNYKTTVNLTFYRGTRWNIIYKYGDKTLRFSLFRPEGKTPLRDFPTREFWNDYDAWKKEQPHPRFDFDVEIGSPTAISNLGPGIEYKKISSISFYGYPLNHMIVERVARDLKEKS